MKFGTLLLALSGVLIGTVQVQAQETPVVVQKNDIVHTLDRVELDQRAFGGDEAAHDRKGGALPGASSLIEGADSLFSTGYDFQTNAVMPRRIINWGRDDVSPATIASTFIYMAAQELFPTTPGRGTYGAVLADFGAERGWLPLNLDTYERMESSRSGFCDIDYFKTGDFAGQVVVASHSNDLSLVNLFLETDGPGSGQYLEIQVPGTDGALWPRVAVDGENIIHLIWTYQGLDGTPDGREGIMAYTRSTDLGANWDPVIQFTTGRTSGDPNALPTASGADGYQIDANGSHVVIWYYSNSVNLFQISHSNYGDVSSGELWQVDVIAATRYRNRYGTHSDPDSVYYNDPRYDGTDTTGFVSDTTTSPGSAFDMMVMSDGSVVGVYTEAPTYVTRFTVGADDTTQSTYLSGLIQRGEVPAYTDRSLRFVHVERNDQSEIDFNQNTIIPPPTGLELNGELYRPRGLGTDVVRWPQMAIGSNGDLFAIFGSAKEGDWVSEVVDGSTNVNYYRSHTYAVRSTDNGASWTIPQDLTPEGVDAQFASIGMWVDDEAHIVLQTDTYPGNLLNSSDTGTGFGLHPLVRSNIEAMIIPSAALAPSSADDARRAYGTTAINAISPNPAKDNVTLSYTIGRSAEVKLEIIDARGKTVTHFFEGRRVAGAYTTMTSVADLASGLYHLVLTVDGVSKTMPMNVVR